MLRHGIIGLGIGLWHLKEMNKVSGVKVTAAADLSAERREKAAAAGVEKIYRDYRELCDDPALDSVSVCLPNSLHAEAAVAAFQSGKHVLVEKPLAVSVEEGEKIVAACRASGKTGMTAMKFRFTPEAAWIRAAVERGEFGTMYHTRTTYLRPVGGIPGGVGGWFSKKRLSGGGAVVDNGVHLLDLQWFLAGSPAPRQVLGTVRADFGPALDPEFDVDDFGTALIKFADGTTAFFENAWSAMTADTLHQALYLGTRGGATMWPFSVTLGDAAGGRDATPPREELPETSQFAHFADCVRNGTRPRAPLEEGVTLLKMLAAVYRSAENGAEVEIAG